MDSLRVSFTIGELMPIIQNLKIEVNHLTNIHNSMMNSYDFNDAVGVSGLIRFNKDLYEKFERRIRVLKDELVRRGIRDYESENAISK
jgi:hypothetical protein